MARGGAVGKKYVAEVTAPFTASRLRRLRFTNHAELPQNALHPPVATSARTIQGRAPRHGDRAVFCPLY